jgi:hypothetical protein
MRLRTSIVLGFCTSSRLVSSKLDPTRPAGWLRPALSLLRTDQPAFCAGDRFGPASQPNHNQKIARHAATALRIRRIKRASSESRRAGALMMFAKPD